MIKVNAMTANLLLFVSLWVDTSMSQYVRLHDIIIIYGIYHQPYMVRVSDR